LGYVALWIGIYYQHSDQTATGEIMTAIDMAAQNGNSVMVTSAA
jgi:hypothetical protein